MEGEVFYAPNAGTGAGHTITVGLSQSEPLVMSIAALSGDNIYSPIDAIAGSRATTEPSPSTSPAVQLDNLSAKRLAARDC